ncbi:MAG: aminopeptidase [Bacteroidetes bacterium]|nr:aminopeptidase [Bacteroidota bacterium]
MLLTMLPMSLLAQKVEVGNYEFKMVEDIEAQPVQDQNITGTCWSFSTLSFIESEIKRNKGIEVKLSEMWIVRHSYIEKAKRYVRFHGKLNMAQGGNFHDVTTIIDKYGIVPQIEYKGLNYGTDNHEHSELEAMLQAMCNVVIANKNRELSTSWLDAITATIDAYLGTPVEKFTYEGKEYTPKSFVDYLDFDGSDYVSITSFTHEPMYEQFILELPDNWMHKSSYNVPLNEFMELMTVALDEGYSMAWGADVSEKGFQHRKGVAIVPVGNWDGVSRTKVDSVVAEPAKQEKITPEMRQEGYDNYTTTDDHGMHITGYAKEKSTGEVYFKVKNSWGTKSNDCGGYFFASESYVAYKTINVMVHKDALPKAMKKKLKL